MDNNAVANSNNNNNNLNSNTNNNLNNNNPNNNLNNNNTNNNNTNNNSSNNNGTKDLSSVLVHIESLQKQLAERTSELGEVRQREEAAKNQVVQLNDLNTKLSAAKREAMREDFNNKVRGWIQGLDSKEVPDAVKNEFLVGAEKFIESGTDNGAWRVSLIINLFRNHTRLTKHTYTGFMQRFIRAPESSEHHSEAHGGLQSAQKVSGRGAVRLG